MKLRIFVIPIIIGLIATACNFTLDVGLEHEATDNLTPSATEMPPSNTTAPTATATEVPTRTPSPAPLPGEVVIPVEELGTGIPWLSLDLSSLPAVHYVGFNTEKHPFDDPMVRQAFAYAIDREVIVGMAERWYAQNPGPLTTLTPPQILGRDLFGEVGANFDPFKAIELLNEAGYSEPSSFPTVTFLVKATGETAPGARFNMATAMAEMWFAYLRVNVQIEVIASNSQYGERLRTNPPELFWIGWIGEADPDGFLNEIFHSDSVYNTGGFSNPEFDSLVERAAASHDPAERQALYIEAETLLCETEAALIPIYYEGGQLP
jgi:oligopeptide transport system substrate-binding protein